MAVDTRVRLIETTARLLQHRGYHGTSLSDILEASGAPRGSLYFHFPGGKDQLAIEATRAAERGDHQRLHELEEDDADENGDEPWQPVAQHAAGHARDDAHRRATSRGNAEVGETGSAGSRPLRAVS